jgi:hypothetical protein
VVTYGQFIGLILEDVVKMYLAEANVHTDPVTLNVFPAIFAASVAAAPLPSAETSVKIACSSFSRVYPHLARESERRKVGTRVEELVADAELHSFKANSEALSNAPSASHR